MMTGRIVLVLALLAGSIPLASPPAAAQAGSGGHGGRHGHRQNGAAAAAPDAPQLKPDPVQRLDAGALLCRTEDALRQHQAAILARLDGRDADEPAGCHLVAAMTPVTVLGRHGPASTEVHLPGPPDQVGWTDAAIRDSLAAVH